MAISNLHFRPCVLYTYLGIEALLDRALLEEEEESTPTPVSRNVSKAVETISHLCPPSQVWVFAQEYIQSKGKAKDPVIRKRNYYMVPILNFLHSRRFPDETFDLGQRNPKARHGEWTIEMGEKCERASISIRKHLETFWEHGIGERPNDVMDQPAAILSTLKALFLRVLKRGLVSESTVALIASWRGDAAKIYADRNVKPVEWEELEEVYATEGAKKRRIQKGE